MLHSSTVACRVSRHFICIFALATLAFGPSFAHSAEPEPAADSVEQAKAHAKAGTAFLQKDQYREALEEFRKAMALKRTRGAVGSVASTLKLLGQYDESLETYEDLLNEFKDLPAPFLAKVNAEVAELRAMMGTLTVHGDTPAGSTLFVDDRLRGRFPLPEPLRLARGIRNVRLEKDGFEPIAATVDIVASQERRLELKATTRRGRLTVRERHNWPLQVEIDGRDMGLAPWTGFTEPGEHRVRIHGFLGLETLATCDVPEANPGETLESPRSGVKMESPRSKTFVELYQDTEIVLSAVDTDASLRVESTPPGALVMVDYGQVGLTPWEGRVPIGEHIIEVNADGFYPTKQTVIIERRKERDLAVVLSPKTSPKLGSLSKTRLVLAFSGLGLGLVGIGTGIATGRVADTQLKELAARCGGTTCTQAETPQLNQISALATTSTTAFVLGTAGIVGGSLAWVIMPARKKVGLNNRWLPNLDVRMGLSGFQIEGKF